MSKIKEEEVSAMASTLTLSTAPQKRTRYILDGEIRQTFSLPDAIMYYIAMNPSTPKVYQKLIQCCKYFFNKNPILVIDELHYVQTGVDNGVFEWKVVLKELNPGRNESGTRKSNADKAEKVDMDAVTCKFWATNVVSIMPWSYIAEHDVTAIIPKIYRCDAENISLTDQILTLDNFLLLASNAKCFKDFNYVTITENDGKTQVPFEKVIERCPNIRYIRWGHLVNPFKFFSSNTVKELIKLPNFAQITYLLLHSLPEAVNPKELFDYVKNKNKNMSLHLLYDVYDYFHDFRYESYDIYEYSDEMEQQIDEIVDEVLSTQTFTYKPPCMFYQEMDREKYEKMAEIHNRYRNTRF